MGRRIRGNRRTTYRYRRDGRLLDVSETDDREYAPSDHHLSNHRRAPDITTGGLIISLIGSLLIIVGALPFGVFWFTLVLGLPFGMKPVGWLPIGHCFWIGVVLFLYGKSLKKKSSE